MIPPYPSDTRAKGWRFEIDTEKVKASETWLRAKTGALRGALLLLWSEAWQQTPCGSLPADDELVSLLIDMPVAAFTKHRAILMRGWWLADDGRLYHDTITSRVLAMLDKRASDAERASARRARLADEAATTAVVTTESRVTNAGLPAESGTSSTPSTKHQAPEPRKEIPPSGERGKPRPVRKAPDSFVVTAAMRSWAAENTPTANLDLETEKFRDYTFATSCIDWPGRWRNWLRKSVEFGGKVNGHVNKQEAIEASNKAVGDRWLAEQEMADATH